MTKAVVIGASGGIGSALVAELGARRRFDTVYALSRSGTPLPGATETGRIDLLEEASIRAAAARVGHDHRPVDLILVASGQLHGPAITPEKALKTLDPAAMATLFAVNATGPALVAKHFVPLLPRTGRCIFAALSARVGSIGDNRLGGWYSYRAAKAALNQILRTLAIEVARTRPEAIVVGLHPGTVTTALSDPFQPSPGKPGVFPPDAAARHLLDVLDGLNPAETGGIFAWDGKAVPP